MTLSQRTSLGLLAFGAALSLAWFFLRPAAPQPAHEVAAAHEAPTSPIEPLLRPRAPNQPAPAPGSAPDASYRTALAMFREYSKYPPNSRPADDSSQDIAEPLTIAAGEKQLSAGTDALGRTLHSNLFCLMQPSRHTLSAGEKQTVTLRCRRGSERAGPSPSALPLAVGRVAVERISDAGRVDVPVSATFSDSGSQGDVLAGDGIYTLTIPVDAGPPGVVEVTAQVQLLQREANEPIDPQPVTARFMVAPAAPAHFTGKLSDELKDGSLVVTAEVDVAQAGRYRFFANLEHEGELVAYAKQDGDLSAGKQNVELLFFGKILREKQLEGSFVVTNLRGQRFNLDPNTGALAEPLTPILRAHETRSYVSQDFSDREWDSPYKQERLLELTALAEKE